VDANQQHGLVVARLEQIKDQADSLDAALATRSSVVTGVDLAREAARLGLDLAVLLSAKKEC
jgi:hypothetical protein